MDWTGKKVLVTGGASFIGSHLVDALLKRGSEIRIIDDLSSGSRQNIHEHLESNSVEFIKGDLRNTDLAQKVLKDIEVVFHLATNKKQV